MPTVGLGCGPVAAASYLPTSHAKEGIFKAKVESAPKNVGLNVGQMKVLVVNAVRADF